MEMETNQKTKYCLWYEEKFHCPSEARRDLLDYAVKKYLQPDDYEYGWTGDHQNKIPEGKIHTAERWSDKDEKYDKNRDGKDDRTGKWLYTNALEVNCLALVNGTLKDMGFPACIDPNTNRLNLEDYCILGYDNKQQYHEDFQYPMAGDIVYFGAEYTLEGGKDYDDLLPFHVGFLSDGLVNTRLLYTFTVFSAMNPSRDIDYERYWGSLGFGIVDGRFMAYLRPKDYYLSLAQHTGRGSSYELRICNWPTKPEVAGPEITIDPLVLDLDGDGISTLSQENGVFFDFDANGFHELSGWIGAGSGLLMLDLNGNGELDDGSELFGDFTMMPTGENAGNGFHALSQYDDNMDGQIDANDAIWSQLGVYYDTQYYTPESAGGG
jgi:hypothetical protein